MFFSNLNQTDRGCSGGLCTPCTRLFPPAWDRVVRLYRAAARCDGPGLSPKSGRAGHSHSKSSSCSQHSPELNISTRSKEETLSSETQDGLKTFDFRLNVQTLIFSYRLDNRLNVKPSNGAKYSGNNFRLMKRGQELVPLMFSALQYLKGFESLPSEHPFSSHIF